MILRNMDVESRVAIRLPATTASGGESAGTALRGNQGHSPTTDFGLVVLFSIVLSLAHGHWTILD